MGTKMTLVTKTRDACLPDNHSRLEMLIGDKGDVLACHRYDYGATAYANASTTACNSAIASLDAMACDTRTNPLRPDGVIQLSLHSTV